LAVDESAKDDLAAKLKALSLERGESTPAKVESIAILEKEPIAGPNKPPAPGNGDSIEGYTPRQVRFASMHEDSS
jgi:hypothetical protein